MIEVTKAAPNVQVVEGLIAVDGPGFIATMTAEAAQVFGEQLIAAALTARGHRSVSFANSNPQESNSGG